MTADLDVYRTVADLRAAGTFTTTVPGCPHEPLCPTADQPDHDAARIVASHPEQGWNLLCNHIIVFEDTGELVPDGSTVGCHIEPPQRGPARHTEENR